ncbi:MAG: sulfatase-like hydrolase/transferase, partial [Pseudomonadota bacterium]|nr:sulfatase-like hydrolase/transferase [Pseudomonadota bacterium]
MQFQMIAVLGLNLALGGCSAISAAEPVHPDAMDPRPNVILILTDDLGYGDLGYHGNTAVRTPNIDRLASESVRLTNFHVDPTCSPTRAALMTGKHSLRTGVWLTVMGRSMLPADEITLAEHLREHGYRAAIFGKWHLG